MTTEAEKEFKHLLYQAAFAIGVCGYEWEIFYPVEYVTLEDIEEAIKALEGAAQLRKGIPYDG